MNISYIYSYTHECLSPSREPKDYLEYCKQQYICKRILSKEHACIKRTVVSVYYRKVLSAKRRSESFYGRTEHFE